MAIKFGPLVREEYESNCIICGNPTRFAHVNPSGSHIPCCRDCHHTLKDSFENPQQNDDDDDDNSSGGIPGWVIVAVIIIVLISLGLAKACQGPTLGNYQ